MSGVLHSAMPSNSSPPPNATGGAAAVEHDAELLAAKKEPSTDSASNDGNQANGVADTGVQEEHESSKKGSSTDQAIDASGLQSSATLVPYEPAVSMSSPPKSSFMSGIHHLMSPAAVQRVLTQVDLLDLSCRRYSWPTANVAHALPRGNIVVAVARSCCQQCNT